MSVSCCTHRVVVARHVAGHFFRGPLVRVEIDEGERQLVGRAAPRPRRLQQLLGCGKTSKESTVNT
eukprot:8621775-Pyramimonas_sp.AAC.2